MKQSPKNMEVVYCGKCGMPNPERNKFCYGCGASLFTITCSYCSTVNPAYAQFCGTCGRELRERK